MAQSCWFAPVWKMLRFTMADLLRVCLLFFFFVFVSFLVVVAVVVVVVVVLVVVAVVFKLSVQRW